MNTWVGMNHRNTVILMMSSGNFDGMNLEQLAQSVAGEKKSYY